MPSKKTDDENVARRAEMIRQLAQGDGLSVEKIEQELGAGAQLWGWGVSSSEALYDLIRLAAASLLDDVAAVAIRNALGLDDAADKGNLTARREYYMRKVDPDISYRGLVNREQKGAEMLARQIDVVGKIRPDVAQNVDVHALIGKVEGMKQLLEEQAERLELLTTFEETYRPKIEELEGKVSKLTFDVANLKTIEKIRSESPKIDIPDFITRGES